MEVILRRDVHNLGKTGDVVEVADGYARNYLVPHGMAMKASKGAIGQAEAMRRARDVRDAEARGQAEEVARQLVPTVITVAARAGAEGKLFGSVTTADIVEAVELHTSLQLDRKALLLDEPIKSLGVHHVPVKLHTDVEFPLTVEVVAS